MLVIKDPNWRIIIQDARSLKILDMVLARNRIVDDGLNWFVGFAGYPYLGGTGWTPNYIATGTSGNTVTAADHALGTEVFRKAITRRIAFDKRMMWQLSINTSEANGNTLREAGLFLLYSGGTMIARVVHQPIVKDVTVNLIYQCDMYYKYEAYYP
jgi:hypothetical protein